VAKSLRDAYGRGIAVVGQDNIRRVILRDRDRPGTANIGLIDAVARYSLEHGFHVVVEGILDARRYGPMLTGLARDHCGPSHFYYLDVSFEETIRRHATRPQATEFGPDDMRQWYLRLDLLPSVAERVIGEGSTLAQTVELILAESGLISAVVLKAESAAKSDIPSWLELAAEVEPLFGPAPRFEARLRRAIELDTALVVRDPREVVLGGALLSFRPESRQIRWLAVRSVARRRGIATILMAEIQRRWPDLTAQAGGDSFGKEIFQNQPAATPG
jgi:Acetyltransferase (GNAT) domain, PanZ